MQRMAGTIADFAHDFAGLLPALIAISVIALGVLLFCFLRIRKGRNDTATSKPQGALPDIAWTAIPVLVLLVVAVPGFAMIYADRGEMTIRVTGAHWHWHYEYPDDGIAFDSYGPDDPTLIPGDRRLCDVNNPLVVPEGMRVKFIIHADDVIRSFSVPQLAVRVYAPAGRTREALAEIPRGDAVYYGQCNVAACGGGHYHMPIVVKAVSRRAYRAWVKKARSEFPSLTRQGLRAGMESR